MYVRSQTMLGEASVLGEDEASIFDFFRRAARTGKETVAVGTAIARGITDENQLTNLVFFARHPELGGRRLRRNERGLAQEWLAIRDGLVRPIRARMPLGGAGVAVGGAPAPTVSPVAPSRGRLRSTSWLRQAWSEYKCAEPRMTWIRVFGRWTPVNPLTVQAFGRLEQALLSTGFQAKSAWNYVCREIKGHPGQASLHAYGLAIDLDPDCNPHRLDTPHPARFSNAGTQEARCKDVRNRIADTSFTPQQVAAVEAIRTVDGQQVFAWGGRWSSSPDAMHFQINVSPQELQRGIAGP